jgi:hypothetical protein
VTADHRPAESLGELPAEIRAEIVSAAVAPMRHYCRAEGKRMYVDKSLDSFQVLPVVHDYMPSVRYILLFRQVMDAVLSGLEASPWGFQAYGYAPFVHSTNFVAGLVAYWQAHVEGALQWEAEHPELCYRVRYEDLVASPEATVTGIFEFLGVAPDLSVLTTAFHKGAIARGPGDYKVAHTTEISARSIGRGRRVPVNLVPAPLLEATNAALAALGYDTLGERWNSTPGAMGESRTSGPWGAALENVMSSLSVPRTDEVEPFAVVAEDYPELRWLVDPRTGAVERGGGTAERAVIGVAEDLVLAIRGDANIGTLQLSGRIRPAWMTAAERPPGDLLPVRAVLRLLQEGTRRRAAGVEVGEELLASAADSHLAD